MIASLTLASWTCALDAAVQNRWTVVSMKDDWNEIFPPAVRPLGIGGSSR